MLTWVDENGFVCRNVLAVGTHSAWIVMAVAIRSVEQVVAERQKEVIRTNHLAWINA